MTAGESIDERWSDELRDAGLRATAGRMNVLDALTAHPHSDAETLRRILTSNGTETSVQSVHNILADLTSAQLLRRIEPAGSAARYERRIDDNHHHVVCRSCGTIADIDCVHGSAPCLNPSSTEGFAIDTAEIVFWGLCAACQIAQPSPTPSEGTP